MGVKEKKAFNYLCQKIVRECASGLHVALGAINQTVGAFLPLPLRQNEPWWKSNPDTRINYGHHQLQQTEGDLLAPPTDTRLHLSLARKYQRRGSTRTHRSTHKSAPSSGLIFPSPPLPHLAFFSPSTSLLLDNTLLPLGCDVLLQC